MTSAPTRAGHGAPAAPAPAPTPPGRRWPDAVGLVARVLLGGVLAIIGFFVIPVLGLPIGFVGGLYLAEYSRLKDGKTAWNSSWESIKAIGLGAAIEFALAMLAAITFGIGVLIHFFA